MSRWVAMLLIPVLALTTLSIVLPLTNPACERYDVTVIHAVLAGGLLLGLLGTLWAWRARRNQAADAPPFVTIDSDAGDSAARRHFEFTLGAWTGTLFCLVIVALWIAPWVLSPCDR